MLIPVGKLSCLAPLLRAHFRQVNPAYTLSAPVHTASGIVIMASGNKAVIVPPKRANADYPVCEIRSSSGPMVESC